MLQQFGDLINILNSLSPLGVIALLVWVVYLLVSKRSPLKTASENRLHESLLGEATAAARLLQAGALEIANTLQRIEITLGEVRDGINYLKGRMNGRSG